MTVTRRTFLGTATGVAAASLLAACDSSSSTPTDGGSPRRGGSLRMAYTSSPATDTLDPINIQDVLAAARALNVYERLGIGDLNGEIEPRLYTEFEPNHDTTQWTLRLRKEARFADGTPVTAADVLASIVGVLHTESGSGLAAIDPKASRALDQRTARFVLHYPVADLAYRACIGYIVIAPGGRKVSRMADANGSGPYRITEFAPGRRSVIERRKDYWGGDGRGLLDRIELTAIGDSGARVRALRGNQIDWADDITYVDADELRQDSRIALHKSRATACLAWFLNMTQPPFDDPRLRLAVKYGIDRQALVRTALYGFGRVGNDVWGAGLPGYDTSIPQRRHDPDKARALVKQAGGGRVEATFLTSTIYAGITDGTQLMAEQLKDIGFDIDVRTVSADSYYADTKAWFKASAVSFSIAYPWSQIAPVIYTKDAPYNFGWHRPEFDAQFNKAIGTADEGARNRLLGRLENETWQEGFDVIWGLAPKIVGVDRNVGGVDTVQDFGIPDLTKIHRT